MYTLTLENENDATRVVVEMSKIIQQHGEVTVADLRGLVGLGQVYGDNHVGWKTTNHVLQPTDDGNVTLEFPEPIDLREPPLPRGTIRLTLEFDATEEMEQAIATFLSVNTLRTAAKNWSVSKRILPPGPRIRYNAPVRPYGEDDI